MTSIAFGGTLTRPIASYRALNAPTIDEVSRLCGVSAKTVSRVANNNPLVSDKTRERVMKVIQDLGYVANPQARALALRRNFAIGMVYDNPNAQLIMDMQQGILNGIAGTEFSLVVKPVSRGSPNLLDDVRRFLISQRLHGVVFLPPVSENSALVEQCESIGCRYVRIASTTFDQSEHLISSDDSDAAFLATRYLIDQGHERIGMVMGPDGFLSAAERRKGFDRAIAEAGLQVPQHMLVRGQHTYASGRDAAALLMSFNRPPTAIFANNDEMAAGIIAYAHEHGIKVPHDLSVIGFDDSPMSERTIPPLTTVRWPIAAMAQAAALKLISDDDDDEMSATFTSSLIVRQSVAPPRIS